LGRTGQKWHAAIAVETAKQWSDPALVESRAALAVFKNAESFAAEYKKLREKPGELDDEYFVTQRVANFFEYLGAMHRCGWVSTRWVDETVGSAVIEWWRKWQLAVAYEPPEVAHRASPSVVLR